ncbi:hypothetical protein D9758_011288 [Tetrapyrgos nigripes]|uniref:Enoyl reductase (ER) domain-containing protein n=1 Tax=Tetrapyrgos nigripes TaxID=182062 RepID=A0A8H5CTK4_9AGAR|nr:hypothetical protein D9758_011288 [Tetrapyrgos nigripes]
MDTTGKILTAVSVGSAKDVDIAVDAAQKAYKTNWGLHMPGSKRGEMLNRLADLVEKHKDELAALEALDAGKPFFTAQHVDIANTISTLRYYAGWADKIHGKTIETSETKLAYTRHEPFGVVMPIRAASPDLENCPRTCYRKYRGIEGNEPSENTPLSALKLAGFLNEAGFPPGVLNIVNGLGPVVGEAMAYHPLIRKISFTGSTVIGRRIQEASAKSNLKAVTLELGGKNPNIIFEDANLDQAVKWACIGQVCTAGSRIFVQEGIHDAFIEAFTAAAQEIQGVIGDPFSASTMHGPQVSKTQLDRILGYINGAKAEGAIVAAGGQAQSGDGYFIQPTIFTGCKPNMKIVQEEVFGPVAAVIKFKTEEEVIEMANDSLYGLASGVFTENSSRAIRVAHALETGMTWINSYNNSEHPVPFGGFKQSGVGTELGEYALNTYTQVKAKNTNFVIPVDKDNRENQTWLLLPDTGPGAWARAAVITQLGPKEDLVLDTAHPVPSPATLQPGQCLIKISYAGVCHSDLSVKNDDWGFPLPLPIVGGHEGIGTVVAVGAHTFDSPVQVGDRVGLKWIARSCLKCEFCRKGLEACCSVNGTWADYVVGWTDYVQSIPESLDSAAATPILCAGVTVYKALKQSKASIGEWIAIPGAGGGLGHLAVQYAKAMGLRIIAIDTGESKRSLCIDQLGAEKWIDFMESKDIINDVKEASGGLGPHAAVISVGNAKPFNQALSYLRAAGTLVAVGVPAGAAMLNVPIGVLVPKCLNIIGSSTGNRQDAAEALDIAAQGKVKCHYEVREWAEINE